MEWGGVCCVRLLLCTRSLSSTRCSHPPPPFLPQELRKSRLQHLWEWGRALYRAAAVSYAAFGIYQNPWLVMALMKATWAATRFLLGAAL